jgi:chemotaxis methyl-accepting protein methylase
MLGKRVGNPATREGNDSMNKLTTAGAIFDHELSELRSLIERQTGVVLDCPNNALAAHVAEYIEAQTLESSGALLEGLRSSGQDPIGMLSLLDGLINVTAGFFRHPGAMNALTRQVVPQLCARKAADGPSPIRIWSAGCGTGEETYSIAIAVCDALSQNGSNGSNGSGAGANGNGKRSASRSGNGADSAPVCTPNSQNAGVSVHIVGSDLLPRNIEVADRGVYPLAALEGLPPAIIRNYFSKMSCTPVSASEAEDEGEGELKSMSPKAQNGTNGGANLLVKPRLRSLVTFNCMNLARPSYIGRFDCIFCLDVMPHFSRPQRIALLERLHLYLEPGGYLFLSQTEKLVAPNLNFRSETFDGYTFHRKPLAASAAYGR